MNFWKKFGWFTLGFTPVIAAFIWQLMASFIGVFVYSFYMGLKMAGEGTDTSAIDSEALMEGILSGTPYAILTFVVFIGYIVISGVWYWLMFCRKKQTGDWKQVLKPHRIGGIIGAGIAMQIGISMVLTMVLDRLPKLAESYSAIMETLGSESVFMILCVCILAPIGEELIFRGLTFRILEKGTPWQIALVIQGLLFGLYHMNLVQGVYAAIMGWVFGYLAHRYGSVVPGILLHIAVNTSSYFLGYLIPESVYSNTPAEIIIALVGIAATVGFLYLTIRGTQATQPGSVAKVEMAAQDVAMN